MLFFIDNAIVARLRGASRIDLTDDDASAIIESAVSDAAEEIRKGAWQIRQTEHDMHPPEVHAEIERARKAKAAKA